MNGEDLFNKIKSSCVGMIHEGASKSEISKSIEYYIIKEFDNFIEANKELSDNINKIQALLDDIHYQLSEK